MEREKSRLPVQELNKYAAPTFMKYSSSGIAMDVPGQEVLLSCNEAIARGGIEAGVKIATSYPGSPLPYVIDNLVIAAEMYGDMHVEWSSNEKVAFEVALGGSMAGVRSLCVMKNVGTNWIVDPLTTAAMFGTPGLVFVEADDPGSETSSVEQDTRYIGMYSDCIVLDPSSMQEVKDCIVRAFDLSEKTWQPVMVRVTERMGWGRQPVTFGPIQHRTRRKAGKLDKSVSPWTVLNNFSIELPNSSIAFNLPTARHMRFHDDPHTDKVESEVAKLPRAAFTLECVEEFPGNSIALPLGAKVGVISSSMAFNIVMEALKQMKMPKDVAILKLCTVYPLPTRLVTRMLSKLETVLVVEEVEPFIEDQVRSLSADMGQHATILGKRTRHIPFAREQERNTVGEALAKLIGTEYRAKASEDRRRKVEEIRVTERDKLMGYNVRLCPGCPEAAAMYALKKTSQELGIDYIAFGDNGCHEAGRFPPLEVEDINFITMGTGLAAGQGMFHSGMKEEKIVSITGDSCFFHADIPALINAVYNKANILLYVMDNRTTGMTGHQPHPGAFGITASGGGTKMLDIAEIAKACQVDYVEVVDPYDQAQTRAALRKAIETRGVSVVVARRTCAVLALRQRKRG